jgi:Hemerythrin HHE cation binding domain
MSAFLPPLPPLPGEDDDYRYRPTGRSIIAVLAEEHEQIAALCAELSGNTHPRRDLADVVTATVTRHVCAEEQYLYPVVRAILPKGEQIAEREIKHDTDILKKLALLETIDENGPAFRELVHTIDKDLRSHQRTCTREIFPGLEKAVEKADLIRLGNRVELAEEAAPTRPHPGAAVRPPLNKVTDPMLGLVDKVRDVATGRATYPEDL